METEEMKERSIGRCLKDGLKIFKNNIKLFLTSPFYLAMIVIIGLLSWAAVTSESILGLSIFTTLVIIANAILTGYVFTAIRKMYESEILPKLKLKDSKDILSGTSKTLVVQILGIILLAICIAISTLSYFGISGYFTDEFEKNVIAYASTVLGVIIMLIILPSYTTISYRLMTMKENALKSLSKGLRLGFKFYGQTFALIFTIFLISVVVFPLIMSSEYILIAARKAMKDSIEMGDRVSLPTYVKIIGWTVSVVTFFLMFTVEIALSLPLVLHIWSIERKENNIQKK